MAVWTAMAGQSGEHEAKTVKKFRTGAEGTADPRYSRPLSQSQSCGNIKNFIYLGFSCLGHSPSGVGGERLQITAGAFCVKDTQSQRRFSGAGDAGNPYDLVQGNIYIYIFQVVDFCAADPNGFRDRDI